MIRPAVERWIRPFILSGPAAPRRRAWRSTAGPGRGVGDPVTGWVVTGTPAVRVSPGARGALTAALLTLLTGGLVACRPAPDTRPPAPAVTADPAPGAAPATLRLEPGALSVQGRGTLTVTCDTPAGPLVRPLTAPARLPLPPGTDACEADGALTVRLPRPQVTPAGRAPQVTAPGAPVTGGTLRVTPDLIRLGEREVWTVTADLRRAGSRPPPDGTPVTLTGAGGGERFSAIRLTVSGVVRWQLTPTTAGRFTFTAASGTWTARATASARSGLLGGRPRAVFTGRQLTLGPLRWADGALPDDGTPVRLRAVSRAGHTVWSAVVPVAAGQVQADVPRVPDAVTLRAELAGSEVSFSWR